MRQVYVYALALVIVLFGFWPTFYSNPTHSDAFHLAHGVLLTGWMAMVVLQPLLIARGHRRTHRLIGRLSLLWVPPMVVSMVYAQHLMFIAPFKTAAGLEYRLIVGSGNLATTALFVGLYGSAVYCAFRRKLDHHARFIACTLACVMPPAMVRAVYNVPGLSNLSLAAPLVFAFIMLILVGLLIGDWRRSRRVYPAYSITLAAFFGIAALAPNAAQVAPYLALARAMGFPG